jgi:1,4-dihydroxy-2-naphthoate octaprenyltransferase
MVTWDGILDRRGGIHYMFWGVFNGGLAMNVMIRTVKLLFLEVRPHFLLLSVVLSCLGTSMAWYDGYFNLCFFILAFVGLLLIHASCNVLNDYFDYRSGIDKETVRTPFSGGSGLLAEQALTPQSVYLLGVVCFGIASGIGLFFLTVRGLALLPILIVAGLSTYFYSTHIARLMLGEVFAGLNLGILPVLATYFVQTGSYSWGAFVGALPSGLLTYNLLLVNEFPDVGPDSSAGRRNMVIALGKRGASVLYLITTGLIYLCIILGVHFEVMPIGSLLGLLTMPIAWQAVRGALSAFDARNEEFLPVMGSNVAVVLVTQALIAVGYVLQRGLLG